MEQYCNVATREEAEDILRELGLTWKHRIEQPFVNERLPERDEVFSFFVHFMSGPTTEIAYYCKPLHTLIIFETPRIWLNEFLSNAIVVLLNYYSNLLP